MNEGQLIRVFLVSGDLDFCHRLAQVLARCHPFRLCGQRSDAALARDAVAVANPDLVVADTDFGREVTIELVRALNTACPRLRILAISSSNDPLAAEEVLVAGARGVLLKTETWAEIIGACTALMAGEMCVSKAVGALLLRHLLRAPSPSGLAGVESLTNRELRVFELLGSGYNTREVAKQLHLSCKTVESHRENIKHRLGLDGAAALTQCACAWMQRRTMPPGQLSPRDLGLASRAQTG